MVWGRSIAAQKYFLESTQLNVPVQVCIDTMICVVSFIVIDWMFLSTISTMNDDQRQECDV